MADDPFPISGYGRRRLLETAEELLDERGLDGASARAISAASGHRNTAAVVYHFGNRDNLVRAVLTRRADVLDAERNALLDELEAKGLVEPTDALRASLQPLVALLDDASGRRYLRLLNQAANHPAFFGEANIMFRSSVARGAMHLLPLLAHLPAEVRPDRAQRCLGMVLYALAEQARLIDARPPLRPVLDNETFMNDLITSTVAALRA
jgi:AcrR family transcriptional regulator